MNYKILHDEIVNDPTGKGYASMSDTEIADALNAETEQVTVASILSQDVIEATVPSEYQALTDAQKQLYDMFISAGSINPAGANTRQAFANMFGPETQTRANLLARVNRPASRSSVLGLPAVTEGDVIKARSWG